VAVRAAGAHGRVAGPVAEVVVLVLMAVIVANARRWWPWPFSNQSGR